MNDVPKPTEAPNQFLVKIQSASLCHSDLLHAMRPDYAVTLGHEGVGTVERIGESVSDLKVGDIVGWGYTHKTCGKCEQCEQGQDQYCPNRE